jgi:hypothetical protein
VRPSTSALLIGILAVLPAACGGAAGTGTIVGGIEPAGLHPRGTYVVGVVHVTNANGENVATTRPGNGHKFRLQLRPGDYLLRAEYRGETCVGRAVVKVATTVTANVICY